MVYSTGEVAKMLGISTASLRNWERHGLIPKPCRRPTNRRQYTEEDINSIKEFLKRRK